jgi:uncharacterized protein YbaR (Trm112 family)
MSKTSSEPNLDASVLAQFACPACRGILRLEADRVVCRACGRIYPVVDGIPALIVERAIENAPG